MPSALVTPHDLAGVVDVLGFVKTNALRLLIFGLEIEHQIAKLERGDPPPRPAEPTAVVVKPIRLQTHEKGA